MKYFLLFLLIPFIGFSAQVADIRFETNKWTLGNGVSWSGIRGEFTIEGDSTEYRRATITIDVPPGTTDLYLSGDVYFENILPRIKTWETPKFKFLPPNSNATLKACNFNSPIENSWYKTYCHLSNFDQENLTQVTLEISIQNTEGIFKVKLPEITDTEPVTSPYSFPFDVPTNPVCALDLNETDKESFNNDLLSSNCHYSFNWPSASWSTPELVNVINSSFPHSNYRFPGGTVGNFYNWETDGYHNDPSTFDAPFRQSLFLDSFRFDYSGFKQQVISTNGSATLMFNVIHDNVSKASNRLRSRLNDGLNVKWIELGNENYFPTQAYGNISNGWQNPDADSYIAHTKELTDSLKSIDPNVKVAVNMNHLTYDAGGWSDKLTNETYYDATVLHNYISPRNENLNFNTGSQILRSYAETKKNLDLHKQYFGTTPTIVTEWGLQGPPESFLSVIASADIFMALLNEGFSDGIVKQAGIHMFYHSDNNQHQTSVFMENGEVKYTATGIFFSKLFDVFKDATIYKASASSDILDTDLPSVNARAVDLGDSIKVFAVNKLPVASELQLTLDATALENNYRKEVFAVDILSGWPNSYASSTTAWTSTTGTGNAELPAYSITVLTMAKSSIITSTAEEKNLRNFIVSPNPTRHKLFVQGLNNNEYYEILDMQGKILYQGNYTAGGINTTDLAKGMYLIKIGKQTKKFQKQ